MSCDMTKLSDLKSVINIIYNQFLKYTIFLKYTTSFLRLNSVQKNTNYIS